MDCDFPFGKLLPRRDALEFTRVDQTPMNYNLRNKIVNWVDLEFDFDTQPEIRQTWNRVLDHKVPIHMWHRGNKPTNAFVDRLLSDGRVKLAEFFLKMLVAYRETGWLFDKNLHLVRNPLTTFCQTEYRVISSFFFCKHAPGVMGVMEESIDLHAAYTHLYHPVLLAAMTTMADFYKRYPNFEDKYYTTRLLSRLLITLRLEPSLTDNIVLSRACGIMSDRYFPEVLNPPDDVASCPELLGYKVSED